MEEEKAEVQRIRECRMFSPMEQVHLMFTRSEEDTRSLAQLSAAVCVLGSEPGSSVRAASSYMYVYIPHPCLLAEEHQKVALELWMTVRYHVGTES